MIVFWFVMYKGNKGTKDDHSGDNIYIDIIEMSM